MMLMAAVSPLVCTTENLHEVAVPLNGAREVMSVRVAEIRQLVEKARSSLKAEI